MPVCGLSLSSHTCPLKAAASHMHHASYLPPARHVWRAAQHQAQTHAMRQWMRSAAESCRGNIKMHTGTTTMHTLARMHTIASCSGRAAAAACAQPTDKHTCPGRPGRAAAAAAAPCAHTTQPLLPCVHAMLRQRVHATVQSSGNGCDASHAAESLHADSAHHTRGQGVFCWSSAWHSAPARRATRHIARRCRGSVKSTGTGSARVDERYKRTSQKPACFEKQRCSDKLELHAHPAPAYGAAAPHGRHASQRSWGRLTMTARAGRRPRRHSTGQHSAAQARARRASCLPHSRWAGRRARGGAWRGGAQTTTCRRNCGPLAPG